MPSVVRSLEVLAKPGQHVLPGLSGLLLDRATARIVVKSVVGAGIDVHLVGNAARDQRLLQRFDSRVDPRVQLALSTYSLITGTGFAARSPTYHRKVFCLLPA